MCEGATGSPSFGSWFTFGDDATFGERRAQQAVAVLVGHVAVDRGGTGVGMSDLVLHEALWVVELGEMCDVEWRSECKSSSLGKPAASRAAVNASLALRLDKRPDVQ